MDVDEALELVESADLPSAVEVVLAAEVRTLREALRGSEVVRDLANRVDRIGELERERDALAAEVRRLRAIEQRALHVLNEDEAYDGGPEALYILGRDCVMDVDEALTIADTNPREVATVVLATEVRRLRGMHQPETAEIEDVNGNFIATYCGCCGQPWPCESVDPSGEA
jgi:hypothetical protein